MKIGLMLPQTEGFRGPGVRRWTDLTAMASVAEDVGFDSLWVVDHFLYQMHDEETPRGVWECWSLLSALAATTARAELGTLVLGMGFRNPALLAKMADTVDEISGGRLILGIGAGYHQHEYDAFGYPYTDRFQRFAEGIEILHGLLRNGHIDFQGKFHSARDCELLPRGPRPQGPPILVGTMGYKTLRLMARFGDEWNAYYDDTGNSVKALPALRAKVDEACNDVGRDPATMRRSATVLVADPKADPWWERLPTDREKITITPLAGESEEIAEALRAYEPEGINHIQICLEPTTCETIESFSRVLESLKADD